MNIGVIGAGGWGTTLANMLAEKGYDVKIWCYDEKTRDSINLNHENSQFLPGVRLSENLKASIQFSDVIPASDIIVNAVPSAFVRTTAKNMAKYFTKKEYKLVSVSKGLEYETFKLMSQILKEELPKNVKIASLSGPNHAEEVSRKMITATTIASKHPEILDELVEVFKTNYFHPYGIADEYGIEICGAMKNITAIGIGICDGLNLGDNSKASLMTLGLTEMNRVGKHYGVKRRTFFGLAGVGDLIATCTSKHSRNRFYGEQVAKGKTIEEIKVELHGMVAEGVYATKSAYAFSKKHEIQLPLTEQLYFILYENKKIKDAINDLLKYI